jgi:dihydroorotase/N-acyl-D-amino-acid deacylase
VYPYTAGSTSLSAVLPPYAHDGGTRALLDRLRSADERRRMAADIESGLPGWQDLVRPVGWENVVVSNVPGLSEYEGRSVAQIAADEHKSPTDAAFDLLLAAKGAVLMVIHMMHEDDVRRILAAPFVMIGSDGVPVPGKPHPRLAGTFVRVLGHYARDAAVFGLAEAVHRMTGLPARRFGLHDRGAIRDGAMADLVVFDPETVCDQATYDDPLQPPIGVDAVAVAGQVVVRGGADTGVRPVGSSPRNS